MLGVLQVLVPTQQSRDELLPQPTEEMRPNLLTQPLQFRTQAGEVLDQGSRHLRADVLHGHADETPGDV